ncbi:D-arabinono-1,4-lactone oxidase [Rosenbergiella collisarenosi]|uniref:D-arabinono-1,4-lactone oxidase n=1 Tax=Rosenbergiella collisarenosi TaxID=1544695 RepID=UPI001BDB63DA|nr:FAD-binding protein [Rosenbergiella collisarenosi]
MIQNPILYPQRSTDEPAAEQIFNWARNAQLGTKQQLHTPKDEQALQALLAESTGPIRIVGSRLSPGRMVSPACEGILLDLKHFRGILAMDEQSVRVAAGTPLQELFKTLQQNGRMLKCSPGVIAVQTVGGALATGTHGQGLQQSAITDEVLSFTLILASGEKRTFQRGDAEFSAVMVNLGCLGIITEVTLATVPERYFTCHKTAVSADTLESDIIEWNQQHLFSKAWWFVDDDLLHVWNIDQASSEDLESYQQNDQQVVRHSTEHDESLNATIDQTLALMHADTQVHGHGGKQFRTVARFKDFTDVTGDIYQLLCRGIAVPQINVEIGVPLAETPAIIRHIKQWYAEQQPHMHYPIILRCTGASEAWLSPAYQQDTCYFGFVVYYADDGSLSQDGLHFLTEVEKILATYGGRPHWGKYYDPQHYDWAKLYPKWQDFAAVKQQLDPQQRFSNHYIHQLFSSTIGDHS